MGGFDCRGICRCRSSHYEIYRLDKLYNDDQRNDNLTNFGNGIFDHYVLNADWNGCGAGTSRFRIFKNGASQATWDRTNDASPSSIKLGTEDDLCQFGASVDEFRVSSFVRSDNWVDMTYDQVQDTVNTYGSEESAPAASGTVDVKVRGGTTWRGGKVR